MNTYCNSALNQIKIALTKTNEILDQLGEDDLQKRPSVNKHSIRELVEHLATICKADLLISCGATQDEMNQYYETVSLNNLVEIKRALWENYHLLRETYINYSESELHEKMTSYWGVTYTRFEWLLEILAHVFHHRGQLHSILVHCYRQDPNIILFE